MSRFVASDTSERIKALMFGETTSDSRTDFLRNEISRYIPQLVGKTEEEILDFVRYQEGVYLEGKLPEIGRPIASLNPTFVDSMEAIQFSASSGKVYTRASVKENGYRMQLHVGESDCKAFTRQFTKFDLRMFPELKDAFSKLPVMIGDAELVNRKHRHLAGFNRVQLRIPNQTYWPKPNEEGLSEEFLSGYLADKTLFSGGEVRPDLELTLVFHGVFAIADPSTWDKPRNVQMQHMISFCHLPVNYKSVDAILDLLATYMQQHSLATRVVERFIPQNPNQLRRYVDTNRELGYEGTCVVQTVWKRGKLIVGPRSVKIKAYETLDCVLLGLYLGRSSVGILEENITGALVGLYDESLGVYLSAAKVNLDPEGVQIKTSGQKERLEELRKELLGIIPGRIKPDQKVHTLYDTFLMQGKILMKYIFGEEKASHISFEEVLDNLPLRSDLLSLYEMFVADKKDFCGRTLKLKTVPQKFINQHLAFFEALDELEEKDKKRFLKYFGKVKQIKSTSIKLIQPQVVIDTTSPIILETQVFDIKWGASPYPAGFHSWFGNSFRFNNCFAERVRHDKATTTDYLTVHSLARVNTPK